MVFADPISSQIAEKAINLSGISVTVSCASMLATPMTQLGHELCEHVMRVKRKRVMVVALRLDQYQLKSGSWVCSATGFLNFRSDNVF